MVFLHVANKKNIGFCGFFFIYDLSNAVNYVIISYKLLKGVYFMAGKGFGLYDKTITVRVNAEQYERYKQFCLNNRVQLNELVRFLLDRAVAGDDKELHNVLKRYESLNTLKLVDALFRRR